MAIYETKWIDASCEKSESPPDVIDARSTGLALAGGSDWSVSLRTLRGGPSDGVDVVEISSGTMTVSVLPTRGMGLWKASLDGGTVGWNSPVKHPVHPALVDLGARNGLGWLDGFNELMCRCGLSFNGPPGTDEDAASPIESEVTLHGKIANTPAHEVSVLVDSSGPGTMTVKGVVDEATLFGPQLRLTSAITLVSGSNRIEIIDDITNFASRPAELELLYHTNIGPPVLGGRAKFVAPVAEMAPRDARAAEGVETYQTYLPPTPGYSEQAYFFDLLTDDDGHVPALLHNGEKTLGFLVEFEKATLPCFTLWKCTQPEADGYVTGLEPGTNFPNFKTHERKAGRVVSIAPGESYSTRLAYEILETSDQVNSAISRIEELQSKSEPTIHPEPHPRYSAV